MGCQPPNLSNSNANLLPPLPANAVEKINVVGTSGSGKSTFAKRLAKQMSYPYIQLDELFWLPNWQETPDDEFFQKVAKALDRPNWVLDGNYKRTTPIKWKDVDVVIWLDYSFWLTFWRACKRAITRIITKKELWPGTGNIETWGRLFSKESVVWWTIITHHQNRFKYQALMEDPKFQRIRFYRLGRPKEAERFLATLKKSSTEGKTE